MEPIYLVNKNSGISYEISGVVIHNGRACYKAKLCWADTNSSITYIPLSEIGPSYEYDKDYYIREPNTDQKEEDLFLADKTNKIAYKIICLCMNGGQLCYKLGDTPYPSYILKSVVDSGDYQIKRIAEVDKMQEDLRIDLDFIDNAIDKVDQKLRKGHYITFVKTDGVYIKLLEEPQEALIYPFKTN